MAPSVGELRAAPSLLKEPNKAGFVGGSGVVGNMHCDRSGVHRHEPQGHAGAQLCARATELGACRGTMAGKGL